MSNISIMQNEQNGSREVYLFLFSNQADDTAFVKHCG